MKKEVEGLFFKESASIRSKLKKSPHLWGPMPPVPNIAWRPPSEFPNLSAAKVIGLDTETYDPELLDAGPGWGRGKGHIVGVSLSVADGTSWYFPMRHGIMDGKQILPPEHAAMNMNPDQVLAWLRHVLGTNVPKVGANLIYDIGWLAWEGVNVGGRLHDIQFAEALLNSEAPDVSLDNLASQYLDHGKSTSLLYEWLHQWNKRPATDSQRAYIYMTPPMIAGEYGQDDAKLPIQILNKQWTKMHEKGVLGVYDLECRSIPLLVKMRLKGTPVNVPEAERVHAELSVRAADVGRQINHFVGFSVNPGSPTSLTKAFSTLGLDLPKNRTKKGGEESISFSKEMLERIKHPFTELVLQHRGITKVRDTFVKAYIIDKNINGRLYCLFHPLKSDQGGTRSGRYSSGMPNLQNIPVRTEEGRIVRRAFDGTLQGKRWRSFDYSSIEYRLLAHFAVGPGSDEVRAIFVNKPESDYHRIVGDMIERLTGIKLERGPVKNINFGCIAEGELVLTDRGYVPIESVQRLDKVWDGEAFVSHEGVIYTGTKEVLSYAGIWATADHIVWDEAGNEIAFGDAANAKIKLKRGTEYRQFAEPEFTRNRRRDNYTKQRKEGNRCNLRMLALRKCEAVLHRQFETGKDGQLRLCKKSQILCTTGLGKIAFGSLCSNPSTLRYRNASVVTQLQGTRHQKQFSECGAFHFVGISPMAQRRIYGNGLRQNRQQWPLSGGQFAFSDAIGESGKQRLYGARRITKTYDILNAGPRHRYCVNGVLVHNCIYGMSRIALAGHLKLPQAEADNLMGHYHSAIPYAKATMEACADEVRITGMVRTLLNRASDFNTWSPTDQYGRRASLPYEEAFEEWGYAIERANLHKALNRKLQGSAADIMKKAMVEAYEAGLFEDDACGIPSLTVHDELDFEDLGDLDNPAWIELKHVMETSAAPLLRVPLIVESGVGNTWADAH